MMKPDRQALEALLETRRLHRTLVPLGSTEPIRSEQAGGEVAPTGIASLDRRLLGGLPRGQLSEIIGDRSTGRSALLAAVLGEATRRGELVALVDPCDAFDPASGMAAGIDLSRLLWIRGDGHDPALGRALKAIGLLLQSGDFGIVGLDLADCSRCALRNVPFTTWRRMQRYLEGGRTACVLVGSRPMGRGPRGVTLVLRATQPVGRWTGQGGRPLLEGLTTCVRIRRACRPGADGAEKVELTLEAPWSA